jgi:hypothetical protein
MSRYDSKTHDEVASRKSDAAQRRTRPADVGPPSPAALDRLLNKDKTRVSHQDWFHATHRENQFPEDAHDNGRRGRYENDVKDGWLRGTGGETRLNRPGNITSKYDINNKPQKPTGPKCEASGKNMESSPFSRASKSWQEK